MGGDQRRWLLLLGLFTIGYFLVLAWDEDFSNQNIPPNKENSEIFPDSLTPLTPPASQNDVPQVLPPSSISTPNPSLVELDFNTPPNTPNPELIKIHTDTYELWVNLVGGNVVNLKLKKFPISLDHPDIPITLLEHTASRVYIAQSGLKSMGGPDKPGANPPLYSVPKNLWVADEDQPTIDVPFVWRRGDGMVVTKTYRCYKDSYKIEVLFEIDNQSSDNWRGNLFAQMKKDRTPPPFDTASSFGPQPYHGAAFTTPQDRYLKLSFDDLDEESFQADVQGGWVAILQHYFLSVWVPQSTDLNRFYAQKQRDNTYRTGFLGSTISIASGQRGSSQVTLYAGPKLQSELAELAENLELTVDYGFLWWLSQPLFWLMKTLYGFIGNWGAAIIALTFAVKLVLYPLSAAAYKSMANMRRVAPELKRIQERHSDDRQKLSQAMMGLYKKERINPLGGCLPILLQMPVFLALYWVLYESVELHQAPFIFWIQDLSVKDPYFVLPILMGVTMYLQQLLNPPIPDPMQAKIIKMMPIVFTLFFLVFPSGLVLYWLTNNVLSIAQQYIVNRQYEHLSKPA